MKRRVFYIFIVILQISAITGCSSPTAITSPTSEDLSFSTPHAELTGTPMNESTVISKPTNQSTLGKTEAQEVITALMTDGLTCSEPCFWGILPGKTTMNEAKQIFEHLGFPIDNCDSHCYLSSPSGLKPDITVSLSASADIIASVDVNVTLGRGRLPGEQDTSGYMPDKLIKAYGTPSDVVFTAGWGPGPDKFFMEMYFKEKGLYVLYVSGDEIPSDGLTNICPLSIPYSFVQVLIKQDNNWLPPRRGVTLESATKLSLEEFARLMTGDPSDACIAIQGAALAN